MQLQRPVWSVLAGSTTFIAAMAANSALKAGWRRRRGQEPPSDPTARDVPWQQALLWVALSSLAIALAKLAAGRATAVGWERLSHRPPPNVRYH